jgi:hypothetical protein
LDIFPSKTWFFGIYLNFQWQKLLKNQCLPHSESKSYEKNSIKSCSSRSFQEHKRHIPIPPKFSAMIWFTIQELLAHSNSSKTFSYDLIYYSRTFASQVQRSWNQAYAPLLIKSFPKTPRTQSEASWFSDLITTKQNKTKQITFLHR